MKIQSASDLQLKFADKLQSQKEAYYTEQEVRGFRRIIFIEELPPKNVYFQIESSMIIISIRVKSIGFWLDFAREGLVIAIGWL